METSRRHFYLISGSLGTSEGTVDMIVSQETGELDDSGRWCAMKGTWA